MRLQDKIILSKEVVTWFDRFSATVYNMTLFLFGLDEAFEGLDEIWTQMWSEINFIRKLVIFQGTLYIE